MRLVSLLIFTSAFHLFCYQTLTAQTVTRQEVRRVVSERIVIDKNTKFLDNQTGNPISYQTYRQLMKEDQGGYKLVPVINEYGVTDAYIIRPTTTEERETRRFIDHDPALKPKAGEAMPEFVMKGVDEKEYRLSALKGRVVVLSFWISPNPPYWNVRQATMFTDALRPYQTATNGPVVLGVFHESKEEVAGALSSQAFPFIAIPNANNFSRKFHLTRWPCVFVIDKAGNVAAYLDGPNTFDQLTKALEAASR